MSNNIYECIGISGFDTSDINSGQFYDLSIISQRKKMEKCKRALLDENHA